MIIVTAVKRNFVRNLAFLGGDVPCRPFPCKITVLLLWADPSAEFVVRVHHAKQVDALSRLNRDFARFNSCHEETLTACYHQGQHQGDQGQPFDGTDLSNSLKIVVGKEIQKKGYAWQLVASHGSHPLLSRFEPNVFDD